MFFIVYRSDIICCLVEISVVDVAVVVNVVLATGSDSVDRIVLVDRSTDLVCCLVDISVVDVAVVVDVVLATGSDSVDRIVHLKVCFPWS